MRGLQRSDHRLFVTVCHRHLPAADREIDHRLSRQARHRHRAGRAARGRPGDPAIRAVSRARTRVRHGNARSWLTGR